MPTHPDILTELAARYGKCDAASENAVEAFYARRFPRLPRRLRERIGFEIACRDGENPARMLSPGEVSELDSLFEQETSRDTAGTAQPPANDRRDPILPGGLWPSPTKEVPKRAFPGVMARLSPTMASRVVLAIKIGVATPVLGFMRALISMLR